MSGRAQHAEDAAWRPRGNPWLIAVVVTLAAFMEILDTTIVNVSLPYIAGSVSVSYDDATWTLTSYLVANGIVLTISGWLSRLLGRKRYFLICIAMFTVSSFLCGIANSLGELIVFRLMQGFFGGGLQPNQQSIILDNFPPADRGRAFSVVAVAVIFAPVIGPTLGGWITDNYTWRWIFFVNIPVGAFTFFAVSRLVEDPPWVKRDRAKLADVDYVGLALITLGLGSMQIMLDRGEDLDWFGSAEIRLFGVGALVGIIGAIVWLLYTDKPIVNLRAYRDRNFSVASIVIFGIFAILYSSAVLIPQLAQEWLGYTAYLAGLVLSPGALLILFLVPIVARLLLPRVQTRYIIGFGFFSLGVALIYAYYTINPMLDFTTLCLIRAAQTFGLAFLFVPTSTIAYVTMPREMNNDATALYVMMRNIAGSVGISLAAAAVTNRAQVHQSYLTGHLTPLDQPYNQLLGQTTDALRTLGVAPSRLQSTANGLINQTLNVQAHLLAYMDVFAFCSVAAFLIVPLIFLFRPSKAGGGPAGGH
jgi:MFS transporter, DHA2 family, multidrug resistance protein